MDSFDQLLKDEDENADLLMKNLDTFRESTRYQNMAHFQ